MGNVIMKAQQIAYGASNVEKALDDLKAPELIELNKRMAAIDAWKANVHEETFTGSELTIENALALPARSLKTTINAMQDLHGYDHPWAGGAGKNKLNYSAESFSVDKNRTETLLGTFTCTESVAITASWYQSVALSDSERNTITVTNQATGTVYYATNFTEKALAQGYHESPIGYNQPDNKIPAGTYNVKMWSQGISDNYTLTQPMIRLSSDTDTTWKPYSNICPISGRTAAVVTRSDGDEISEDFTIQLGQTVYGADINWDTGVGTVKRKSVLMDGTQNLSISVGGNKCYHLISDAKVINTVDEETYDTSVVSEFAKSLSWLSLSNAETGCSPVYGSGIAFKLPGYTTTSEYTTYFTNNPTRFTYELENPIPLQLTPEQLEMLKGYNRVSIDNGSIELKALVLGGDY